MGERVAGGGDVAPAVDEVVRALGGFDGVHHDGKIAGGGVFHAGGDIHGACSQTVLLVFDVTERAFAEQNRREFTANVSHELKTPIALIQGYAEGLKEGVNEDAESREFYCDVIMDEASKMNQMVKNLLTLNQLEFGDEDIVFDRFNLTALIRGVLQSMEIMADQAGAKILLHIEEVVLQKHFLRSLKDGQD